MIILQQKCSNIVAFLYCYRKSAVILGDFGQFGSGSDCACGLLVYVQENKNTRTTRELCNFTSKEPFSCQSQLRLFAGASRADRSFKSITGTADSVLLKVS